MAVARTPTLAEQLDDYRRTRDKIERVAPWALEGYCLCCGQYQGGLDDSLANDERFYPDNQWPED